MATFYYCLNKEDANKKLYKENTLWKKEQITVSGKGQGKNFSIFRKLPGKNDEKEYYDPKEDKVWVKTDISYNQQEFAGIILYFLIGIGTDGKNIYNCNTSDFKLKDILSYFDLNDWSRTQKPNKSKFKYAYGFPFFAFDYDNKLDKSLLNELEEQRLYLNDPINKDNIIDTLVKIGNRTEKNPFTEKNIFNDNYDYFISYNENGEKVEEKNRKGKEEYGMPMERIKKWINEGGVTQIILTGAPGTGKTRMAKELAKELGAELRWEKGDDAAIPKYKLVQFHPSYDYTDFVEGLRPVSEDTGISFKKIDGIFKKFCREVVKQNKKDNKSNEKKYFFIIDEINRADLSKVFGELMYCLESDKRGKEHSIDTQYQNLPTYDPVTKAELSEPEDVFFYGFYIPENVVIIGTMNDIDRSVESMDFALRRRFMWMEVDVTEKSLKNALKSMWGDIDIPDEDRVIEEVVERISALNSVIKSQNYLGKHYYISQGQFANLSKNIMDNLKNEDEAVSARVTKFLKDIYDYRLKSLFYEYIRGEGSEDEFLKECCDKLEIVNENKSDENQGNPQP